MEKINCLIVEDDAIAKKMLISILDLTEYFKNIFSCSSVKEAREIIRDQFIQVIFLDVELPNESGIELLKQLGNVSVKVILISSTMEYAVHGFEFDTIDFILKPPTVERVQIALSKLETKNNFNLSNENRYFFLKSGKSRMEKISVSDIYYIESVGNYMSIYCANNSRFITSGTLKYIEEKLPNNFMRVHNSYLVNIDKISAIESNCIILNKKPIPVSRSNWKILNQRLDFI